MPPRRSYTRWTASEKERLITLRQQHPDMSYTKFANIYYPDRDPRALKNAINAHQRKTRAEEEKARASRDNVTPTATSTTTTATATATGTSSKSPDRVTTVEASDDENSRSDERNEDIYFTGERIPNKRVKLTYSTRSQAALGRLQWSHDSATVQKESSELDKSTPMLSPRLGRGDIVPFSDHASRSRDLQAAENNNENHGLPHSTPPPPPPSIPPPSTPPPPPETSREEQTQNLTAVVAAVDHNIRQSETQDQVSEYIPEQEDLFPDAVIKQGLAQQTAQICQWVEWLLTNKQESKTKHLELENKFMAFQKQYESMEMDKNSQISRLQEQMVSWQTERERLISENMALKNKLKIISDFSGRTENLNLNQAIYLHH